MSIAFEVIEDPSTVEPPLIGDTDIWRLHLAFDEFGKTLVVDLVNLTNTPESEAREDTPDWSAPTPDWPQGRIAFVGSGSRLGLWHMNPDGTDPIRVMDEKTKFPRMPSWSPDAMKISVRANAQDNFDIFAVNPDGSGFVNITKTKKIDESYPVWRP